MKTYAFCPINNKKVYESVVKLNAVFTVLLALTFIFTQNIIPILFLGLDFYLRTHSKSSISDLSIIKNASQFIAYHLKIESKLVDKGPKVFAARIGIVFTVLITLSVLFNAPTTAIVFASVLALFSFLEAAFGFCVACVIYPYVFRFVNNRVGVC